MKKLRTRRFYVALYCALGFSALFLAWFALFGAKMAVSHGNGVVDAVFSVFVLAAGSFLAFCFLPYFKGDRRWYSISALLTVVFCIGAAMLFRIPGLAVAM